MHEHQFNSKGTANSLTQRNHLLYKERDEVNLENARRNINAQHNEHTEHNGQKVTIRTLNTIN